MNRRQGYKAVRHLRRRSEEKRGGNEKPEDGLTRSEGTLATLLDEYLEWFRMHNHSESSVKSRRADLRLVLKWFEERSLFYPDQITRSIIESYQRWMWHYRKTNGKPLGITTQSKRLTMIKMFFSWLCRERYLEANPSSEIILPQHGSRLPGETFSTAEIETVLCVPDISDPLGIRDRAILELFYSSALRRSELVRLQLGDLNRDRLTLHIRQAKFNKDRVVPVGQRAMNWVNKYLEDVRPLLSINTHEQSMFITAYGDGFNADVLGRLVAKYIRLANVGHKGGCHQFRHACATHMLEGGADIRYIQQLLGHANLETTAVYTHVSILQLQSIHATTHPAESRAEVKAKAEEKRNLNPDNL